jgi:FAD/FMN-containing dehydrogenase
MTTIGENIAYFRRIEKILNDASFGLEYRPPELEPKHYCMFCDSSFIKAYPNQEYCSPSCARSGRRVLVARNVRRYRYYKVPINKLRKLKWEQRNRMYHRAKHYKEFEAYCHPIDGLNSIDLGPIPKPDTYLRRLKEHENKKNNVKHII